MRVSEGLKWSNFCWNHCAGASLRPSGLAGALSIPSRPLRGNPELQRGDEKSRNTSTVQIAAMLVVCTEISGASAGLT